MRAHRQAKRCVDTFKQVLQKSEWNESVDDILKFLSVYCGTANPNTISGCSTAELMFARNMRSVFDKFLPRVNKKIIKMRNPI